MRIRCARGAGIRSSRAFWPELAWRWPLSAAFLSGAAAAAGIALVNSIGNIGGFTSTFLVGWMTDLTHSTSASLFLFAVLLVIASGLLLTLPDRLINK